MRYGIIGTGAIGGYYGARLARAGHEVHFLFHSDYEYVRGHGLQVNSPGGSFRLERVNAYRSAADMPQCDVIIVALKTTRESLLPSLVGPLLKPDSLILLIQNGIGVEEDVQRMFPSVSIAAGMAFICSSKTKPGVVDHFDKGSLNIAPYATAVPTKAEAVAADFVSAGVEARMAEYFEARWKKAVWNMPFNGLTVLLEAETDAILADPDTESLTRELMREVTEAANATGAKGVDMNFAEKMIAYTKGMVPYSPSMKVDFDHCREMEIHYLYTRPIAIAKAAGYEMRRMEMLRDSLLFKQRRYLG